MNIELNETLGALYESLGALLDDREIGSIPQRRNWWRIYRLIERNRPVNAESRDALTVLSEIVEHLPIGSYRVPLEPPVQRVMIHTGETLGGACGAIALILRGAISEGEAARLCRQARSDLERCVDGLVAVGLCRSPGSASLRRSTRRWWLGTTLTSNGPPILRNP